MKTNEDIITLVAMKMAEGVVPSAINNEPIECPHCLQIKAVVYRIGQGKAWVDHDGMIVEECLVTCVNCLNEWHGTRIVG